MYMLRTICTSDIVYRRRFIRRALRAINQRSYHTALIGELQPTAVTRHSHTSSRGSANVITVAIRQGNRMIETAKTKRSLFTRNCRNT